MGLQWEPPTWDERWQKRLDRMTPRDGTLSWLKLVWEPGDELPGEPPLVVPVERWCVYQMIERPFLPEYMVEWLEGPNPRTMGAIVDGEWESHAPPISLRQWELYDETGCFGEFWWIIQGTRGGHLRRFNEVEQKMLGMAGMPTEPPHAGDLPYAPPDNRFFAQVKAYRRLKELERFLGDPKKAINIRKSEKEAMQRTGSKQLYGWLMEQMMGVVEENDALWKKALEDAPWAPHKAYAIDRANERAEEDFITKA